MSANSPTVDFSELLLGTLGHRDGEYTSLLYIEAGEGIPHAEVAAPGDAVAAAAKLPGDADCFFGVNPVEGPARKGDGKGTEDDVARLAALFCDLDVKPGACPKVDVAKAIVAELSIILGTRPSTVVYSGGGVHAYWPILDGDDTKAARVILKRWHRLVAAVAEKLGVNVDNVYNMDRVLRIPGTYNHKTGTPRPVTAVADSGGPLELAEVAERLDEWGIYEIPEDSATTDHTEVSTPSEWQWAATTCGYVATMIEGFATDSPKKGTGRSPWLISCKVRLNCAKRLGCITEADYEHAKSNLEKRFAEIVADPAFDTPRPVKKLEHRDTMRAGVKRASAKTDEQCRAELGNHRHEVEPSVTEVGAEDFSSATAAAAEATTWEAIDLVPWLSGEHVSAQPAVGISRTDGRKLIYPGREHTVFGETEAGKSWFALECVAVEIRMGRDVVYIHYEEGDPGSTIERLRLLSVTPEEIRRHLRFVAPARPVRGTWLAPLLDPPPVLVIHDGVNEAMSLHGDEINQTDGAATFRRTIIKPFLAVGAATLSCDHVIKNSENRGRYAIGSGHKVNAIDGAAFLMENIQPFGRGLRGASSVYVTKDRPGQLRAHGKATGLPGKTLIGVLTVDATGDSEDFLTFWPPKDKDDPGGNSGTEAPPLGDIIYTLIAAMPGQEVGALRTLLAELRNAGHQFRDTAVRDALDDLVVAARLAEVPGKRNSVGYRLPTASRGLSGEVLPATASASASPIGGEAGSGHTATASEAVGSSGKQSPAPDPYACACGERLMYPDSIARKQCVRCYEATLHAQESAA